MGEADKSYELKMLKMVINKYLDESTLVTEADLNALEVNRDQVVWDLSTRIYNQSGHKAELSIVRDVIDSRIEAIRSQLITQKNKERIAQQSCHVAEQEAQKAAEEAHSFIKIASALTEFGEDKIKAQIFVRLRRVISEQLSVNESKVALDSHIAHDLGADELDTVELAVALEEEFEEFEIEISDDLLGSVKRWPPSYSGNTFGDSDPVACTVRDLLLFIHKEALARSPLSNSG